MNMEMTWLDFQLSTDNQNGRQLATNFFQLYFVLSPTGLVVMIDFGIKYGSFFIL